MTAIQRDEDAFNALTANATTYYFPVGGNDAGLVDAQHITWDATFVGVITFEDSNYPDVALTSTTAGDWIPENPTTGTYVGVVGAGASATGLTITITGGAAGGAMVHLGNIGSRRMRVKLVSTTGGRVRSRSHAKQ